MLIVDKEFSKGLGEEALQLCKVKPLVIDYDDPEYEAMGEKIGTLDYEALVPRATRTMRQAPGDEWDAISLNYTSGTTGDPKGVVYHHRGAALLATGQRADASMKKHAVYLWTLPMFHCNGWCFPWSISVIGGTHVCLRRCAQAI
jgi:fatty-acyl-CoA synthase